MNYIIYGIVFLLGAIVGSFLNVVALRYKSGVGLHGRSKCLSCGKTLSWYELIPLLSFLGLAGRCRSCKSRFSSQYFFGELIGGLFFMAAAYSSLSMYHFFYIAAVLSVLHVICFYDLKHMIIPDGMALLFGVLALFGLFFDFQTLAFHMFDLSEFLAGPVAALPFFLLWLVSKGRWMGLGDAKLALGVGWFLGLTSAISAVVLSFWIGAGVSLILMAILRIPFLRRLFDLHHKPVTMKSEIPFGPFIITATVLVMIWPLDLFGLQTFGLFL